MAPTTKSEKRKKEKNAERKENEGPGTCCVPEEKVQCSKPAIKDFSTAVKVSCSSGKCSKSGFMHADCFEKWEYLIVGFLAKQGRGRTWSDKQRYANVWANKGYDLVFKTCACDCGHGSLRKDLEYIPNTTADRNVAGGVNPNQDGADRKKKKKEKTTLKPKLNFSAQNVSGSYFGSLKQKEDDLEENRWSRETLSNKSSDSKSLSEELDHQSSGPIIPGLNPSFTAQTKTKHSHELCQKASSAPPLDVVEEGWTTVSSKVGNNRRNSQLSLKLKRKNSTESSLITSMDIDSKNNNVNTEKDNAQQNSNVEVHDSNLLNNLKRKGLPTDLCTDSCDPEVTRLPMYEPPVINSCFESTHVTKRGDPSSNFERDDDFIPQFLGARPKYESQFVIKGTDEIYQSDEEFSFEEMDKTVDKLCDPSPSDTPKWSDVSPSPSTINLDKEMNLLWEQTKDFEIEMNYVKNTKDATLHSDLHSASDGKRDKNGFIHCSSCNTVHTSLTNFTEHCSTMMHKNNAMWAHKLETVDIRADIAGGWECLGDTSNKWKDFYNEGSYDTKSAFPNTLNDNKKAEKALEDVKQRALRRDLNLECVMKDIRKQVTSEDDTMEMNSTNTEFTLAINELKHQLSAERESKMKLLEDNESLRKNVDAQRETNRSTIAEIDKLLVVKENLEKQIVTMETSHKNEVAERARIEKTFEQEKVKFDMVREEIEQLKRENQDLKNKSEKSSVKDDNISLLNAEIVSVNKLLASERSKNEANTKLIKRMKEKSDKSLQREKDSRLLAEKSAELAEKELFNIEQKVRNMKNQLDKYEVRVKDAECRLKDEARKRIVAELEIVDQQRKFNDISDKFVKQAAALNEEKNDLAKAVNGLVKDKEVLDEKVNQVKETVDSGHLEELVYEKACQRLLLNSEDILKQGFKKAIEDNDVEENEDVKQIVGLIENFVQSPEILHSPVKFETPNIKFEIKEVTDDSFHLMFQILLQRSSLQRNHDEHASIVSSHDGDEKLNNENFDNKSVNDVTNENILKEETRLTSNTMNGLQEKVVKTEGLDIEFSSKDETDNTLRVSDVYSSLNNSLQGQETEVHEKGDGMDLTIPNSERNIVHELFDELLRQRRAVESHEQEADEWEAFEDELNADVSIFASENEVSEKTKALDLQRRINECLSDDVVEDCLNSIINKSNLVLSGQDTRSLADEDSNQSDQECFAMLDTNEDSDKDSLPGIDRYPQLGLDEEIDPYLGPDEPGEFDAADKAEEESVEDHISNEKYDVEDCPCRGEHNPNGSCKISPVVPSSDPFSGPFYSEYLMKHETPTPVADLSQMTHGELIEHWHKLVDFDLNCPGFNITKDTTKEHGHLFDKMLSPSPTAYCNVPFKVRSNSGCQNSSCSSPVSLHGSDVDDLPISSTSESKSHRSKSINSSEPNYDDIRSMESSRISSLENSVTVLQSLATTMGAQISNLTSQLEDNNFKSGLLTKTIEKLQERNVLLQTNVNDIQAKNSALEKKFADVGKSGRTLQEESVSVDESEVHEKMLALFASCESFQVLAERQTELEEKLKLAAANYERSKVENKELKKEFAQLNDRFSSLNLEYQVDKSQTKVQMDSLGYNIAILTSKLPTESFSSTSGVRSGDTSENEEIMDKSDKNCGSLSPLEPLQETGSHAGPGCSESSVDVVPKSSVIQRSGSFSGSNSKMKKFVYNKNTVNQQGFSSGVGGPLWMSPDGSMVAIPPTVPPTSSHPTMSLPTGSRSMYGISQGRGSVNQLGMTSPYINQQGGLLYPFNYSMLGPNMFYHR